MQSCQYVDFRDHSQYHILKEVRPFARLQKAVEVENLPITLMCPLELQEHRHRMKLIWNR